jgi:hypothetical protein
LIAALFQRFKVHGVVIIGHRITSVDEIVVRFGLSPLIVRLGC